MKIAAIFFLAFIAYMAYVLWLLMHDQSIKSTFEELGGALEKLRQAIADTLKPVLDWLERILTEKRKK